MVIKKMNKKAEATLGAITSIIFISLFFIIGFFLWMQANSTESGRYLEPEYNETYNNLLASQNNLSNTMGSLRAGVQNLTEAGEDYGSAWNGLKGLVQVWKIPLNILSIGEQGIQFLVSPLGGLIPPFVVNIIMVVIITFIILVIASIFKGDPNVIR